MLKNINNHKLSDLSDQTLNCMADEIEEEELVKRITVTLDDETHRILQKWADDEARSVPNLLAWLALKAAKEHDQGKSSDGK
jgi:hypothetical protein